VQAAVCAAGLPLGIAGFRNHGAVLRQDFEFAGLVPLQHQELISGLRRSRMPKPSPAASDLRLRATGCSMLPSLWPGDVLTVRPADPIHRGDVILFRRHGRLYGHRVVRELSVGPRRSFITHGDGLLHADSPVADADVLGPVVLVTRAGRSFPPTRDMSPLVQLVSFGVRRIGWAPNLMVRLYTLSKRLRRQK